MSNGADWSQLVYLQAEVERLKADTIRREREAFEAGWRVGLRRQPTPVGWASMVEERDYRYPEPR